MNGSIALSLNSPITEEQWDIITDVDLDNTPSVIFQTKHGKEVEYVKVVRCKDCKHGRLYEWSDKYVECNMLDYDPIDMGSDFFCAYGERICE